MRKLVKREAFSSTSKPTTYTIASYTFDCHGMQKGLEYEVETGLQPYLNITRNISIQDCKHSIKDFLQELNNLHLFHERESAENVG